MDDDVRVPVSGAHILAAFFAEAPVTKHPSIRARLPRVRAHLLTFLDTEAERWATPDELVIVGAQRQLEPVDAVIRVTGAEVLVAALPGFCTPEWLLSDRKEASAQLRVVAALGHWLAERGYVGGTAGTLLLDRVADAVRRAHALLDGSPAPG